MPLYPECVNSARDRFVAFYHRLPSWTVPVVLIILAVFIANIMYISGLGLDNPISWTAGISHHICRVACGRPAIDPNLGYLTQPLGHLAASDLLHGHLPWWNYYEGLGQPLAGEMQGASLFPLTLLFALSDGLLWFHVCLEIIAGVSTYLLMRRLSVSSVVATGIGVVFALNGTIAWLGNAVLNPVAFLPMLLLGVELIFDGARGGSRRGWYVAAIALALSIYAGFPEVAYLDGVFAFGWAAVRLFDQPRDLRFVVVRRLGLSGIVGTVLALPILIPFYDFYKVANIGNHIAALDGQSKLSGHAVSMMLDPYVYGTLFSNPTTYPFWGGIGGYFGASVGALAILGLFGSRLRPLRIFLVLWTGFGLLGVFNVLHMRDAWNLIPLVKTMAFARYVMPSCEIAMITLAALGIMDFASSKQFKRLFTLTTIVGLLLVLWSILGASSTNKGVILPGKTRIIFIGLDAIPFLALGALLIIGRLSKFRVATLLITLVLVGESILLYFVPTAESPKKITIDQAPITFLQTNEGQYRFLDFGVLNANWGTQYDLNSLSAIDLPFPSLFSKLLHRKLFPALTPLNQFVIHAGLRGIVGQEISVQNHFAAYQAASVKYLLISNKVVLWPGLAKLGVKRVFTDAIVSIYAMPNPTPFYSTLSKSCTVTSPSVSTAIVHCPSAGTTLVRSELWMTGWSASVNGKSVAISPYNMAYQSVAVPTGTSTVVFNFSPPHVRYGFIAALLAAILLLGSWTLERWPARRASHRRPRGHY